MSQQALHPQMSGKQPNAGSDELRLIEALRRGEEAAFARLLQMYQPALVRLASIYVSNQATAEEVAQETWLAVLQGIHRFEGRSSLKTWIFSILMNQAKKRGQREGRQIPFSALWQAEAEPDEPAVDPDRFIPADAAQWGGHWAERPQHWDDIPESRLLSQETQAYLLQAVQMLAPSQRIRKLGHFQRVPDRDWIEDVKVVENGNILLLAKYDVWQVQDHKRTVTLELLKNPE